LWSDFHAARWCSFLSISVVAYDCHEVDEHRWLWLVYRNDMVGYVAFMAFGGILDSGTASHLGLKPWKHIVSHTPATHGVMDVVWPHALNSIPIITSHH